MIHEFQNEYRWLSNFWPVPIVYDGVTYGSVERAYQASKTVVPEERHAILIAKSDGEAKRLGRAATLRPEWNDAFRLKMMQNFLIQKFYLNAEFRDKLLATGDQGLVEGNSWHDNFFGDCHCGRKEECKSPGLNHLGKMIMKIRRSLQSDYAKVKDEF